MTDTRASWAAREGAAHACRVSLQLPGTTESVTCGHLAQETLASGEVVGRFRYDDAYLARPDAVPVDPTHLPLTDRPFETTALGGLFGALRDAGPDAWGRSVIDRALERTDLSEIDYLVWAPEDGAGALSFGPTAAPRTTALYHPLTHLPTLLETALWLESAEDAPRPARLRETDALLREGATAMGGARPKTVVEDDTGLWLAKFPARGDRWNNAPVEAGLLALARRCGITTPPTRIVRVGTADVLLVQRFDRVRVPTDTEPSSGEPARYVRHRVVSALTVLDADDAPHRREGWSYLLLADALRQWSHRPAEDQRELFRRMVFNALVSNLDDHPRNHALIAPGTTWELAPAYDLTPDPRPGSHERDLAMTCGRFGRRARRTNLRSAAPRCALTEAEADTLMGTMQATVRSAWEEELRRAGATTTDCVQVAPAFVDEGFAYPMGDG